MAQRRLHTLTHQFSIAEELEVLEEEGDISRPLEHDEELWGMSSLAPNLALNDSKACSAMAACQLKHHSMKRSNEADLDGNANRRSDEVSGMSSTPVDSSMLSNQNIDTCVGSYSSMESSEPLLLDSSTSTAEASTPCTYSNGGIQMSISVNNSSNDVNVKDRQALEPLLFTETEDPRFTSNIAAQSTCPHKSAALMSISKSAGSGLTGSENSNQSALLTTPTNCESFKPTNLQVANSQRKLTSVDTIKNRHNFWKARSSSTEVPSSSKQDLLSCGKGSPNLSKLVSTSGPLLRANSLERGTQTVPFSQLNTDEKTQARYGSTISVIGTEYMKAKGVITPKFQQLQKPNIQNHETASHSSRHLNDSSFDKHHSHPSGEVQTAVHMSHKASTQPSHVVRIVPGNEDDMQNKRLAIGYRLGRRKLLAERRRKIADLCCIFALVGLLLMIIQTECSIANIYATEAIPSYAVKSLITFTTLILLSLICWYHAVEVKLFVVDNCIEDWRIAMSWPRVLQIGVELFLCLIHPIPIPYTFDWMIIDLKSLEYRTATVPVDLILSLPMFTRLYLIVRVMLLHSKLFSDASSRSIGALNKITFNTRFVLKTLMTIFPGTVMGVFMLSLWIVCAWTFRACESYHDPLFANFPNTLYMIAITFLSVGYGDFVPHTLCGRVISVVSGLMGAGCTALVVAVIARKLELTRAEKHVHNFMMETQLNKKLQNTAANVLRETWLIYKYTKLVGGSVNVRRIRSHQRKFLSAIQKLRVVKMKLRKLNDQANSLIDFAKRTSQVHDITSKMLTCQENQEKRINQLEEVLQNLERRVVDVPNLVIQAMLEKQLLVPKADTPPSVNSATQVAPSENINLLRS